MTETTSEKLLLNFQMLVAVGLFYLVGFVGFKSLVYMNPDYKAAKAVFVSGQSAYASGIDYRENPHTGNAEVIWLDGWIEASREDK